MKGYPLNHFQLLVASSILFLLILLAAFFSAAETGLMALNRYRLRHKARLKKRLPMVIMQLLTRPDRFLGMILIGNTLSNIVASALATLIAVSLYGEKSVVFSTVLLTLIVLVFAEVAPKTVAALYPWKISKLVTWPIYVLLKIFYPLVWLVNFLSNGLLRIVGVKVAHQDAEPIGHEELRSLVYETAGRISLQYQTMLLAILDLNKITVEEIMVPYDDMNALDLSEPWDVIQQKIVSSEHDWLPVYREHVDQMLGVLHLRDMTQALLNHQAADQRLLESLLQETYFVPEGTPLNIQLFHFQKKRKRIALVVDEYGEILGLISVEDILEEIVGEFTSKLTDANSLIPETEGSYLVDGSITIRELNRLLRIELPTGDATTLNGLITDELQTIPRAGLGLRIVGYPIEVLEVEDNVVKLARVFPRKTIHPE